MCCNTCAHTNEHDKHANERDKRTHNEKTAAKQTVFCNPDTHHEGYQPYGRRTITLADYIKPTSKAPSVNLLTSASEINSVGSARGQEIKVKVTADSGAAASVIPATLLSEQVGTRASSSEGTLYCAAGPTSRPIRNVGQRVVRGVNEHGTKMHLPFEAVENITKPLASVSKMVDAGQAVLYHPSGSAIFDLQDARNKELKDILGV